MICKDCFGGAYWKFLQRKRIEYSDVQNSSENSLIYNRKKYKSIWSQNNAWGSRIIEIRSDVKKHSLRLKDNKIIYRKEMIGIEKDFKETKIT